MSLDIGNAIRVAIDLGGRSSNPLQTLGDAELLYGLYGKFDWSTFVKSPDFETKLVQDAGAIMRMSTLLYAMLNDPNEKPRLIAMLKSTA